MRRSVSIRRSLLVNVVVVIVLLSAATLGITVLGARYVVKTLSASLITRSTEQTKGRLAHFFDPVVGNLLVVRSWGDQGLLDLDHPERINTLLVPILQQYPQVSSAMVSDSRGREHLILRVGDTWTCRQTRRDEWGDRTRWLEWTEDRAEPVESWREIDYDPRRRPWFIEALVRARRAGPAAAHDPRLLVHWTDPYTFFTTKDPGITASVVLDGPQDGNDRVIAFDVLLNDITTFTLGLRPSANGLAFVMTYDGKVIGLPRDERFENIDARQAAMLRPAGEFEVPVVRDGAAAYFQQAVEHRPAFRFESEGRAWWAGARPFELGSDRLLLMAVGIPENDLLGGFTQLRLGVIGVTLAVLAGAVWRLVVLSRRFSRPIEGLVRQSERISRGDLEPGDPIDSTFTEVRHLSDAHEKMRLGLRTLMKLERDLQIARQIQEGTFPHRLPEMVGFQLDAWSQPADETGGDTYDVVGYQSAAGGNPIVLTVEHAERAILLLADATGHGIGPAISVTQVRAMLRMAVRAGEDLPRIARHLNEQLCADLPEGRFITAWLGELDPASGTLTSFSAGQGPIIRYLAASDECEALAADDLPLGVVEQMDAEMGEPFRMSRGDIVAVISDGIFEAADPSGVLFGDDRVMEIIRTHSGDSPRAIIETLRASVEQYTQGAPAADDQTGIVIKCV